MPSLGSSGGALTVAVWVQRSPAQTGWLTAFSGQLTTTLEDQALDIPPAAVVARILARALARRARGETP